MDEGCGAHDESLAVSALGYPTNSKLAPSNKINHGNWKREEPGESVLTSYIGNIIRSNLAVSSYQNSKD